jgi:ABC-2 type transport system permease protein
MKGLFEAAGVDYGQWRGLTIAALKLDFRQASFGRSRLGRDVRGWQMLIGQFIFYTMFGVFMAIFAWLSTDLFFVGTALMTYTLFMVGTAVLLDHSAALTSPNDYPILGFRPVSSRTYFAARLTNVLVYTLGMTTVASYLPAASLFVRRGPLVGVAAVLGLYACATAGTLAILFGYATLLRWVGPTALKRALSYIQLGMSFVVYGGYFMISRILSKSALASFTLPKTAWLLAFPATWFASYLELAAGRTGLFEVVPAVLSVAVLVALFATLGGRLSLDYSERIAALSAATQRARIPAKARGGPGFWFRKGEARAIALLVRTQFRNDQRFRMSVLAIVPITLLYMLMGMRDGGMSDPFVATTGRNNGLSLVAVAVMMFPSMLKLSLGRSETFRASWIFFACPTDRYDVIRSSRDVLAIFFLLPYLLFVFAIYAYLAGNILHAGVHVALLGLMSFLCLQFFVFIEPELPFSKPPQRGRNSLAFYIFLFVMFALSGVLQFFAARLYSRPALTIGVFAALIVLSVFIDLLTRARVDGQARSLEFQG